MKTYIIIIFITRSLTLISSPSKDTLIISKNHFLFGRDYGIGLKYNHNYMSTNRNNYGIGYFLANKRWEQTIYEIYLSNDLDKTTQFCFSYSRTNHKIFEGACYGLNINVIYNSYLDFLIAPKFGVNLGAIDINSYCNFLPFDGFRYQNFGVGITLRPQILRNFFRKEQTLNSSKLQYELNQRSKARRKGMIPLVK